MYTSIEMHHAGFDFVLFQFLIFIKLLTDYKRLEEEIKGVCCRLFKGSSLVCYLPKSSYSTFNQLVIGIVYQFICQKRDALNLTLSYFSIGTTKKGIGPTYSSKVCYVFLRSAFTTK